MLLYIYVMNIFSSSFVSNVFSDVIKRILGVFDDETEELKEEEEEKTTRKDDAHRSKCINIVVLRCLIRFNKKSSSVSSFVTSRSSSLAFVLSFILQFWRETTLFKP